MLKIKNILPVFVMLLFLGLADSAYAQLSCNVASTPVSRDTSTGLTEPAGDITFSCVQTGATASTAGATITVDYQGTPITNCQVGGTQAGCPTATGYPTAKPIAVTPVSGPAGCAQPTIGATGVSNATGQVVITVPSLNPGLGATCSFTLTGVLFALAGTGKTSVVATVSVSPGNNLLITAGQNTPTVVTSVLPGILASGFRTTGALGLVLTSGNILTPGFTLNVTENYIDMFRGPGQFNTGATSNGVQLQFAFAGIPANAVVNCAAPTLNNGGGATVVSPATGNATSTAPNIIVNIDTANLNTIDTLALPCTYSNGTATVPLTPGTITATVTLAPVGSAFSSTGAVLTSATTGQIPRYAADVLGPIPVLNIIAATTHMLFPFVSVGNGFDTGFAIANTSTDPYGFTSGAINTTGGARPISGAVTLVFYPAGGGTPFCVATAAGAATVNGISSCTTLAATGSGLGLTSGIVNSGSSWVVLASELFRQVSGAPAVFNGYVFGIANFPYAHPTVFVADAAFSGKFTAGGPALVLPVPSVTARTAGGFAVGLVESLGH